MPTGKKTLTVLRQWLINQGGLGENGSNRGENHTINGIDNLMWGNSGYLFSHFQPNEAHIVMNCS